MRLTETKTRTRDAIIRFMLTGIDSGQLLFYCKPLIFAKIFATKIFAMNASKNQIENPFKFGSVVDGKYFTNRVNEIDQIKGLLNSANHLILIAPRRYGKTSLVQKVLSTTGQKSLFINIQTITSVDELAASLLKKVYMLFGLERLKSKIKSFRIIPDLSINPITQEVSVSFNTKSENNSYLLEDVLTLISNQATKNDRIICVFDEFQDIEHIDKNLSAQLRSIMQHHTNVNYIFMGSQESMMRYIFEDKKSPFYHFGNLMTLNPISRTDFFGFIKQGFSITHVPVKDMQIEALLAFTSCHPYYTQQLAFNVWNNIQLYGNSTDRIKDTIGQIIQIHDYDYERMWQNFNNTDKKIIAGLSTLKSTPLSSAFVKSTGLKSTSTILSGIKRLMEKGYLIYNDNTYAIEDPYFKRWVSNFVRQ